MTKIRDAKIQILMSTYNGEQYIKQQINSIINQTFQNWELLIRDDNSIDDTKNIISYYAENDSRIKIIPSFKNVGVKRSFITLLQTSTAPFFMFSDQDDVWKKDKVQDSINLIKDSSKVPTLGYTGLTVVDQNLNFIDENIINKNISKVNSFERLVFTNQVTGATIIGNSLLREAVFSKINLDVSLISMHDWWISLVASEFGDIRYCNKSTMLYRQHDNNVLGATVSRLKKLKKLKNIVIYIKSAKAEIKKTFIQAEYFYNMFGKKISINDLKILEAVLKIRKNGNFIIKLKILFKHSVNGILQNFFLLIKLF
ncbi:glycosyltransferase family 2 protein [Dellaglioa algida]|uniref:glycosyltransferase family 2 protein n=1 Tax=Dellaglioa algida TaxID=105612 RepID=UPI0024C4B70D|nr:glycosyltransferase family 2 protein [Dellaglioa algida]MDK1724758.1 glycosyltransferase family 2 protein [Dellaglioa algida]MDK1738702.1 glycosyltransferase family 2 protein [Dellaglioa algida]